MTDSTFNPRFFFDGRTMKYALGFEEHEPGIFFFRVPDDSDPGRAYTYWKDDFIKSHSEERWYEEISKVAAILYEINAQAIYDLLQLSNYAHNPKDTQMLLSIINKN